MIAVKDSNKTVTGNNEKYFLINLVLISDNGAKNSVAPAVLFF